MRPIAIGGSGRHATVQPSSPYPVNPRALNAPHQRDTAKVPTCCRYHLFSVFQNVTHDSLKSRGILQENSPRHHARDAKRLIMRSFRHKTAHNRASPAQTFANLTKVCHGDLWPGFWARDATAISAAHSYRSYGHSWIFVRTSGRAAWGPDLARHRQPHPL